MIASKVTTLVEVEGAEVDGVEGVGGVAVPERLEQNCALLHLTVPASIASMTWKGSKEGKGTLKWCKSLVIAEGKMSLSQVVVSL